jgi:hypothetical protein
MANILDRSMGVFKFDMSVFEEIAASKPWLDIAMMISANAILGLLVGVAAIIIKAPASMMIGIPIVMGISLLGLILSPIALILVAGLEHALIKAFGGQKGFMETLALLAYLMPWNLASAFLSAPFAIIGLGFVGSLFSLLTGLASLAENILAVERVHGIDRMKAAAAVLITMGIIMAIAMMIFFAFFALIAGGLMAAGLGGAFGGKPAISP